MVKFLKQAKSRERYLYKNTWRKSNSERLLQATSCFNFSKFDFDSQRCSLRAVLEENVMEKLERHGWDSV